MDEENLRWNHEYSVFLSLCVCLFISWSTSLQTVQLNGHAFCAFHFWKSICLATHTSFWNLTISIYFGDFLLPHIVSVFSESFLLDPLLLSCEDSIWEASVISPVSLSFLNRIYSLFYFFKAMNWVSGTLFQYLLFLMRNTGMETPWFKLMFQLITFCINT